MISRYEAILNGVSLSSINANIRILDISYNPPSMKHETISLAKRYGSRIQRKNIESVSVDISIEIHAYDTRQRQQICNAVAAWANKGGVLETNDRENQELLCVCTTPPIINSVMKWLEPITFTFTAYEIPYWREKASAITSITGASGSGTLFVPGSIDNVPVEIEATANASLSSLALTVNGRTLTLSDLSVSSGSTINISYDEHGIQYIKVGDTSLLNKRTGVDDLLANCGEINTVSFTASASVAVKFKAKGGWM